ncbi:hypothetical protein MLD38_023668 [Melastoma candidum]|uniref:Uncharacterized protein n=1 Tax=Melastoma candidum TaxID=119954 RepID=A0ACB9NTA2_9MYRT|nr:hypothetical protein MLD38_023668 [Melastoma candidum]
MKSRKVRRGFVSGKSIQFALSTCFVTTLCLVVHQLPELPYGYKELRAHSSTRTGVIPENKQHEKLGETMIAMLPQDLPFTVFVPSKRAFERDLRLDPNVGLTHAIIAWILAFSAVPRIIPLSACRPEMGSVSGFTVYISKDGHQNTSSRWSSVRKTRQEER